METVVRPTGIVDPAVFTAKRAVSLSSELPWLEAQRCLIFIRGLEVFALCIFLLMNAY